MNVYLTEFSGRRSAKVSTNTKQFFSVIFDGTCGSNTYSKQHFGELSVPYDKTAPIEYDLSLVKLDIRIIKRVVCELYKEFKRPFCIKTRSDILYMTAETLQPMSKEIEVKSSQSEIKYTSEPKQLIKKGVSFGFKKYFIDDGLVCIQIKLQKRFDVYAVSDIIQDLLLIYPSVKVGFGKYENDYLRITKFDSMESICERLENTKHINQTRRPCVVAKTPKQTPPKKQPKQPTQPTQPTQQIESEQKKPVQPRKYNKKPKKPIEPKDSNPIILVHPSKTTTVTKNPNHSDEQAKAKAKALANSSGCRVRLLKQVPGTDECVLIGVYEPDNFQIVPTALLESMRVHAQKALGE